MRRVVPPQSVFVRSKSPDLLPVQFFPRQGRQQGEDCFSVFAEEFAAIASVLPVAERVASAFHRVPIESGLCRSDQAAALSLKKQPDSSYLAFVGCLFELALVYYSSEYEKTWVSFSCLSERYSTISMTLGELTKISISHSGCT